MSRDRRTMLPGTAAGPAGTLRLQRDFSLGGAPFAWR